VTGNRATIRNGKLENVIYHPIMQEMNDGIRD
jgi:hypothetical protein